MTTFDRRPFQQEHIDPILSIQMPYRFPQVPIWEGYSCPKIAYVHSVLHDFVNLIAERLFCVSPPIQTSSRRLTQSVQYLLPCLPGKWKNSSHAHQAAGKPSRTATMRATTSNVNLVSSSLARGPVALTRGLNHQIVAKGIVIVQVFVPEPQ